MCRSVSSIHLQSGVFGTVELAATSIFLKNTFTTMDYRKYAGRGRDHPSRFPRAGGRTVRPWETLSWAAPIYQKTTSMSTNGFSGFRGILVDSIGQICPVNILKSHDNWTYLDFLKLVG